MSYYNPDQYTEPQSGLQPERSFDELYNLFEDMLIFKNSNLRPNKKVILLWEKFKKEQGQS